MCGQHQPMLTVSTEFPQPHLTLCTMRQFMTPGRQLRLQVPSYAVFCSLASQLKGLTMMKYGGWFSRAYDQGLTRASELSTCYL